MAQRISATFIDVNLQKIRRLPPHRYKKYKKGTSKTLQYLWISQPC